MTELHLDYPMHFERFENHRSIPLEPLMKASMATVVVSVLLPGDTRWDREPMYVAVAEYEMTRQEANARLASAARHEGAIARGGLGTERGEVWLRLRGHNRSDKIVCFRHSDAADALNFYLAVPIAHARHILSDSNVRKNALSRGCVHVK